MRSVFGGDRPISDLARLRRGHDDLGQPVTFSRIDEDLFAGNTLGCKQGLHKRRVVLAVTHFGVEDDIQVTRLFAASFRAIS